MLTGKQFQLRTPTMALDLLDGQSVAVTIPFEAIIRVTSEPHPSDHGMIDALWEDRAVRMFTIDVNRRGTEITES
jgi:hypothetical protein